MNIAILLYNGVTALDAIGPYEVLASMPGAEVHFVASETGVINTHAGAPALHTDRTLVDLPAPDIILVPGCPDPSPVMHDDATLAWLRRAHETSKWTSSVCTGALILGAAGILQGLTATTHWLALDALREFGATPTRQRVVRQGKVITAAGVSAGIDMALTLVAAECGEETAREIQLIIEYDPEPPFDAGSPLKAPAAMVAKLRELYA